MIHLLKTERVKIRLINYYQIMNTLQVTISNSKGPLDELILPEPMNFEIETKNLHADDILDQLYPIISKIKRSDKTNLYLEVKNKNGGYVLHGNIQKDGGFSGIIMS